MASTVTPATATVQIVESLTLGGVDRGGTHTRTINNVAEADRRVMTISTTGNSVLDLNIANGRGEFVRSAVKYIRITNLDDTNWLQIQFRKTAAEVCDLRIEPGATFMLSSGVMFANASGSFTSFVDIDNISAQADTADVDIELVVLTV
jgi:hypothetical protein